MKKHAKFVSVHEMTKLMFDLLNIQTAGKQLV